MREKPVCEVLAGTLGPMTSSAVGFGKQHHMKHGRAMQMELKQAMLGWGGYFQSTTTALVLVSAKRQNNTGSSSGNKLLPLPSGN